MPVTEIPSKALTWTPDERRRHGSPKLAWQIMVEEKRNKLDGQVGI